MANEIILKVIEAYSAPFLEIDKQAIKNFKTALTSENEREILKFIFAWYAFARRGASPYFSWKAIELLNEYWNNGCLYAKKDEIWKKLHDSAEDKDEKTKSKETCELCNGRCKKKVNALRNPLYPRETENKHSIWKINFCSDIINILNSKNGIIKAYGKLIQVWGFGHKIASYILQDLVIYCQKSKYATGIKKDEHVVYYFLQPIDGWLRLIATELQLNKSTKGKNMPELQNLKAGKDKPYVVGICDECIKVGVDPLKFNQGAWYLSARVMRCGSQLRQILRNSHDNETAKALVDAGIREDPIDMLLVTTKRKLLRKEYENVKLKFIKRIKEIEIEKSCKLLD